MCLIHTWSVLIVTQMISLTYRTNMPRTMLVMRELTRLRWLATALVGMGKGAGSSFTNFQIYILSWPFSYDTSDSDSIICPV